MNLADVLELQQDAGLLNLLQSVHPPKGELAIRERQGTTMVSIFNKAELLLKRKSFYGASRPGLETLATQHYRPTFLT